MEMSKKLIYFSTLALVFVVYNFLIGSDDAIGNTITSVVLVGLASILTWAVIREQRKKGRLSL